ncbi:SMI1/KNR4 family protein [Micromonospora chalcea]|uniref:SMI1/KNR4 family protein n=1 Tax=Micromonospora chalcea TaxID=1874 RepID=UPI003809A741
MTSADWSDVPERLARLAAAPGAREVFGAASHSWRLEPPLRAGELAEVEAQLGLELPGEYRSFLLEAGRGGAGPAYGLFPMRRLDGLWQWEGDGADLTDRSTLGRPFPHVEPFNPADGLPDPPDEDDYSSEEGSTRPRTPTGNGTTPSSSRRSTRSACCTCVTSAARCGKHLS